MIRKSKKSQKQKKLTSDTFNSWLFVGLIIGFLGAGGGFFIPALLFY
jgi:uncharacterized membrane protein YfcA